MKLSVPYVCHNEVIPQTEDNVVKQKYITLCKQAKIRYIQKHGMPTKKSENIIDITTKEEFLDK